MFKKSQITCSISYKVPKIVTLRELKNYSNDEQYTF